MPWNDDQRAMRAMIMELGNVLSKDHIARDRDAEFSHDGWERIRDTGLLGLPFDAELGGAGQDLPTTVYVLEGLGRGCRDSGLSFATTTHVVSTGVPLQRFGSAELKRRHLPAICAGSVIGAHAITEPDHGSDVMGMRTTARRDVDEWVLEGSKTFISNAPLADLFTVYARTGERGSPAALTAFLVERDTPGLSVGPPISTMGLRSAPLGEVFLDGCRVPAGNAVGPVGAGFLVLEHVLKWEVLCSFAVTVGEMQHRLERCVEHARSRMQFGRPIGSYQLVSSKIVEMEIGVRTARTWLYDTAEKLARGENVTTDIAITKLVASENNLSSALAAVQIFGGYGYVTDYGLEKDLRTAVAGTIYSGTSETQRQRIASMLGLQ